MLLLGNFETKQWKDSEGNFGSRLFTEVKPCWMVIFWTGAYDLEHTTPILSLCHGIFTDRSIFRLLFPRNMSLPIYVMAQTVRTKMAASAGHVETLIEYPNYLSIFLFHSSHYSCSVSHNPLSYLWHLHFTERWKKLSILVTHHWRSRAQSKCLFLIRGLKQPRRRRQQKPHKCAYLTMKNSIFARFARASFDILETLSFFLRRQKSCSTVVWTTWAYDDKCSILSSYVPSAASSSIPGQLEHIFQE